MKNACIICEYNPFHNGHRYMISLLKEKYGFDGVTCIMSGNYVQRGEPAVLDKYTRAESALKGGADLVIELPAVFATSSARDFAAAGTAIAAKLSIIDTIAFGVESGTTLSSLKSLPSEDSDEVKRNLSCGMTYPEAVSKAYGMNIAGPNTILAAEYLRALHDTDITPLLIERKGDGYADEVSSGSGFASAAAVRALLKERRYDEAGKLAGTGPEVFRNSPLTFPDMLSALLSEKLLRSDDFTSYLDVSREINDRLRNRRNLIMSFSERVDDTKTRQYTRSRISRALLHIVLGITAEEAGSLKASGYADHIRVLGYRKESGLLNEIKKNSSLAIYAKSSSFAEDHPAEMYRDQLYCSLTSQKSEYLRSPVII